MANENVGNVTHAPVKKALTLQVNFERKMFVGDDGREAKYVQCEATYKGETFRFSVKDKDARLFQYLMKQDGYVLTNTDGVLLEE